MSIAPSAVVRPRVHWATIAVSALMGLATVGMLVIRVMVHRASPFQYLMLSMIEIPGVPREASATVAGALLAAIALACFAMPMVPVRAARRPGTAEWLAGILAAVALSWLYFPFFAYVQLVETYVVYAFWLAVLVALGVYVAAVGIQAARGKRVFDRSQVLSTVLRACRLAFWPVLCEFFGSVFAFG
jgi:hypothetical protein